MLSRLTAGCALHYLGSFMILRNLLLYGSTVLHFVARGGNLKTSKALIQKNPDLLQMVDSQGNLPLFFAIYRRSKKLAWYLSLKTGVDSHSYQSVFIPSLPGILRNLIQSSYYGKN
ncbi:hypothetical protein QYF36_026616 [Acer negundo]|nr:hypothetical protein QYF36_012664 [Acer negundo]KAK4840009.1 hypothetical protein QYF36_026616 [Acer negundo]